MTGAHRRQTVILCNFLLDLIVVIYLFRRALKLTAQPFFKAFRIRCFYVPLILFLGDVDDAPDRFLLEFLLELVKGCTGFLWCFCRCILESVLYLCIESPIFHCTVNFFPEYICGSPNDMFLRDFHFTRFRVDIQFIFRFRRDGDFFRFRFLHRCELRNDVDDFLRRVENTADVLEQIVGHETPAHHFL